MSSALSLFVRRPKVEELPPAITRRDARSLNLEDVKQHLKVIRESELESTSAPSSWQQARDKRFKQYDELVKSVSKVDTHRLSDEDRQLLIAVIYEEIPSAAELVGQEAITYWHTTNNNVSTYHSKSGGQFVSLSESVLEIVKKQRDPQYEAAPSLEEANAALMELDFPRRSLLQCTNQRRADKARAGLEYCASAQSERGRKLHGARARHFLPAGHMARDQGV